MHIIYHTERCALHDLFLGRITGFLFVEFSSRDLSLDIPIYVARRDHLHVLRFFDSDRVESTV